MTWMRFRQDPLVPYRAGCDAAGRFAGVTFSSHRLLAIKATTELVVGLPDDQKFDGAQ